MNEDFSWHDNKISVKVKTSVGSSPGDHHSDTDSPQTGSNRKSHTPGKRPSLSIKERNEFFHTNTNPIPRNNEDKDGALVGSPTDIDIVEVSKPVRSFNIPPPILINKSLDAGELNDIYMPSSSLKFMPVDLVGSSTVKQSIAKGLLLSVLARGIVVIKYGK